MTPSVSIIVPIYNSQDYLKKCLNSLLLQTLKEIEIILIDDGSTDRSPEIIDEFAKKDKRIVAIHKQNTGYGACMNQGIGLAKAAFIGTVEADDYAHKDMFLSMYEVAIRTDAQIVKTNYFRTEYINKIANEVEYSIPPGAKTLASFDGEGSLIDPYETTEVFWSRASIWSALYKKDFLEENQIHFLETPGASFQDTGFQLKCFVAAHRVYLLDKAFVHFRTNNKKSTVKTEEKAFFMRGEIESTKLFLRNFPHKKEKLLRVIIGVAFSTYKRNLKWLSADLIEIFLMSLRNDFHKAKVDGLIDRRYFNKSNQRLLWLLLMSPKLFYWYVAKQVGFTER